MKISLKKEIDIFHRLKLSLIIRGRDEKKGKILRSSLYFIYCSWVINSKNTTACRFSNSRTQIFQLFVSHYWLTWSFSCLAYQSPALSIAQKFNVTRVFENSWRFFHHKLRTQKYPNQFVSQQAMWKNDNDGVGQKSGLKRIIKNFWKSISSGKYLATSIMLQYNIPRQNRKKSKKKNYLRNS